MRTSCPPTALSTRCGPSKSAPRSTKSGCMATMPTPATRFTCPSTWSASTCSPIAISIARPPICASGPPTAVQPSDGPCRLITTMCARRVLWYTTTPTTMTSTARAGTIATILTSTTTPTTTVIPATPLLSRLNPTCLARNVPAIPKTATVATTTPVCLW